MSACVQVGEGDLINTKDDNRDQREIDVAEEVSKANEPPIGFEMIKGQTDFGVKRSYRFDNKSITSAQKIKQLRISEEDFDNGKDIKILESKSSSKSKP